ncbi:uncharacterized protein [Henckelia pumila]|uniref:uncharacterized protein n=1 Tax=Henckelia pumila TaxID=405737 RepID=UPI003C6E8C4A
MATARQVQFSLKVMMIKESNKVVYAEVDSDFADVLLSFLTLPRGTIVRLLIKHYGNQAPILGSLNSLYRGLSNLNSSHFGTEAGKLMLLNPRNASGIQCGRLKLQIDDTPPPIQYYTCGCSATKTCVSMYYSVNCLCQPQNSTHATIARKDLEMDAQSGDKSVFTAQTASFLLTDDLQLLANSSASFFQILKLNGIEDTSVLEERTLIVGLKEVINLNPLTCNLVNSPAYLIMKLLKRSLVSKTPITDVILCISSAAKYEPDHVSLQTQTINNNTSPNSKNVKVIKILVQKSTSRVLLAQTWQDFIDFLFSLLTIPLGRVQHLLGKNTHDCLGSISNLYRSISNSETFTYMKSWEAMKSLQEPQLPPYYLSSHQIFSLTEQTTPPLRRGDDNGKLKLLVSTYWKATATDPAVKMVDPKGQSSFVKGPKMFMVTDDLTVSSPPSTSIFSVLNQMKIPPSDVEEQELFIGEWKR